MIKPLYKTTALGFVCCIVGLSGCLEEKDLNGFNPPNEGIEAYQPRSDIFWLGDSFFYIGSLNKDQALIRKKPKQAAEKVARTDYTRIELSLNTKEIWTFGTEEKSTVTVKFDPDMEITTSEGEEPQLEKERAKNILRNEWVKSQFPETGGFVYDISTAYCPTSNKDGVDYPLLARVPVYSKDGKNFDSKIVKFAYWDGVNPIKTYTAELPLGVRLKLKNDPISGDWLAYAEAYEGFSVNYERSEKKDPLSRLIKNIFIAHKEEKAQEKELSQKLKGIPVWKITKNFEVTQTLIPWEDWNFENSPSFYIFGDTLIATVYSPYSNQGGVYLLNNSVWTQVYQGYITSDSLAISSNLKYIAWSERIEAFNPRTKGQSDRYALRIEEM